MNQNKLINFRAFSIGFSGAVLALACGGSDNNNSGAPTTPTPNPTPAVIDVPPETCADNPLLAGCPATNPAPAQVATGPATTPVNNNNQQQDPAALAKAAAENVLASNCGQCHGPALTPQQAKAGMNYINNIDLLVQNGKIVPLDSAGSRIIQRMVRGEMPPISSGLPRVTDADINTVAQFIDNPRFWPNVAATSTNCLAQKNQVDFDKLFQTANQDLIVSDNKDIPFFRYISLTNRVTAGQCAASLDKDRQGLIKMMNMLSIDPSIGDVTPVNADQTLYRVDLRDFQWDRAISVNGTAFTDVWEAIAANNAFAVQWTGDDANLTTQDTGTNFPIMFADQMSRVATIGNLYYAIVGVDVNQTLGTFISQGLGIDLAQNLIDRNMIRAGTTKSRISRQDRLVERDDIDNGRQGALWQSFDFANNANQSIFQDPFGFAPGGTEAIFTLPNGLLAYIIADDQDRIVEDSNILLDTSQNNFRAVTSISCSNCHATGFIPVVDEVRDIALSNALQIGLNRDEVEQLQQIYVTPTEFAKQVTQDSQGFYQAALQRANLPIQGGDPVSTVWLRFDQDLTAADAAGDLGVLPDFLTNNIEVLNPVLSVLRNNGTLDRDDFGAVFVDSLCKLSITLNNQPDAGTCAQAAQALGQ